jgi:glycosyltransferase involved in cell wall biosynthesis
VKILHIVAALAKRYGGPSKACLEMARATAKLGHEVTIFTTNIDGEFDLDVPANKAVWDQGVRIFYFKVGTPRFWKLSFPLARAIAKHVAEFDVVHVHSLYLFPNMVTGYFCRKNKIPYIARPHGTLDPFLWKRHRFRKTIVEFLFENKNLKNAAAIHYTTLEEKELAKKWTFNRPGIIIPNGLYPEDYANLPTKGTLQQKYPELKNKKIILFFGRVSFKKGFDVLIPAFSKLAKELSDCHLVIAGPDLEGLTETFTEEFEANGIKCGGKNSQVTFTGMLEGIMKLAVLNDSDLFVLPSYTENFGISVIEAMACSLPVLISNKVNIWDKVVEADAGWAGPTDAEWFYLKMKELVLDKELRKKMGENGKKLVSDQYSWPQIARKLEKEYFKLCAKK